MGICLTHSHCSLRQDHSDEDGDDKALKCTVETDHVIKDGHKEDWGQDVVRHICKLLSQEVDISAVKTTVVFSQEHWDLRCKNLKAHLHSD